MATFRDRFASRREILLLFMVCLFLVHIWSAVNLLRAVPALILRLTRAELFGVISYTLTIAFLEGVLLLIILVLIGAILPARFLRDSFVVRGSILLFLTFPWSAPLQSGWAWPQSWTRRILFVWAMLYVAAIPLLHHVLRRYKNLEARLYALIERVVVLASFYFLLDIVGIIGLAVRNVL